MTIYRLVTRNDPWNVPQVYSRLLIYQDSWQWWKNGGGGKSTGSLVHSLLRWVAVLGARLAHRVVYTGVFHKISYSNLWFYSNEKMKLWQKISSGTQSLGSSEISSTFNFKIPKILEPNSICIIICLSYDYHMYYHMYYHMFYHMY